MFGRATGSCWPWRLFGLETYSAGVSGGSRGLAVFIGLCALLGVSVPAASAATDVTGHQRAVLVRAAANSGPGKAVGMRVGRNGRVTIAPTTIPSPAEVTVVRSLVNRKWALVVAAPSYRPEHRRAFVLKRSGKTWRVKFAADRGEEDQATCRRKQPGAAVAFDLGFNDTTLEGRCRYKRTRDSLTRPMSSPELASVRAMVEWTQDPETFNWIPGPVQPARSDVTSVGSCAWDGGGPLGLVPYGRVSRADPRYGVVYVGCVVGYDGFSLLEEPVLVAVSRGSGAGGFTAVPGMVLPSWSSRSDLCLQDLKWPVPAVARAGLQFCTPYPLALRNALR